VFFVFGLFVNESAYSLKKKKNVQRKDGGYR
jgi:hypothetical protein